MATIRGTGLSNLIAAEVAKIYAFRISLIAYASIPVFLLLFVVQLFYFEHLSSHLGSVTVAEIIPYLFFASWKPILFQLFIIVFSAYCVAVDSQYGMIRVSCTQPVRRVEYLFGKCIAIEFHVATLALAYVASLFLWGCVCSDFRDWSKAIVPVLWVAIRTIIFSVGLSTCMVAISSLRKTLLTALVSSCVLFACFALLTTLPLRFHLEQALLLRYFFYPISGILPRDWPISAFPMQNAPFRQFALVSFGTAIMCLIPAAITFHFRDISE